MRLTRSTPNSIICQAISKSIDIVISEKKRMRGTEWRRDGSVWLFLRCGLTVNTPYLCTQIAEIIHIVTTIAMLRADIAELLSDNSEIDSCCRT